MTAGSGKRPARDTGPGSGVRADRGSGGVLAVGAVAVVLAATLVGLGWAAAVLSRQRVEAAVDLSALSAAQSSARGADACGAGDRVARSMGVRLYTCHVSADGTVLLGAALALPVPWLQSLGLPPARARARAGWAPAPRPGPTPAPWPGSAPPAGPR